MKKSFQRERRHVRAWLPAALLASTTLAGAQSALAAAPPPPAPNGELIVTAEKREENVQKVPLSIQVLGARMLDQLQVKDVNDYVKFLPSVSVQSSGPGFVDVYMRGVASGENNNHSGPLPTVASYLDEAPITTIGGALDIHVYDIARVEALAGPQGTLYGASSEAGTLRIITNKPRLGITEGSIEVEGNTVDHGGQGYTVNGMGNFPIGDKAAIRLVGWAEHDAGYIDNVERTRTFPAPVSLTVDNAALAKNDFNDVNTYGGRGELKIDLNESWTVTPSMIFQDETSNGVFGYEPSVGDLEVAHYRPDHVHDRWFQAGLTIEGKIGNLDLTYAGSFMKRDIHSQLDYSDYSYFYDKCCGYGLYYDDGGHQIDPSQHITGVDHFTKQSHELRIATPTDERIRFVGGLFYERQTHGIQQRYEIDGFPSDLSVPGWPNTIWLTEQLRVDRDYAAFGEVAFDITSKLTLTGGVRVFKYDNSLVGYYGFAAGFSSHEGVATCFEPATVAGAPCNDLDKRVQQTNFTHKLNLTYHFDDQRLVYATWSRGFRPGGINRRGDLPPYVADFLTNYEVGWKTSWANGHIRFNGAAYIEEWKNFQFSFLGPNGLTDIVNAPQAEIKGAESDLNWRPDDHWSLSTSAAYNDAALTKDLCLDLVNGCPVAPDSPKGTQLPVAPKFKANATVRYEFPLGPVMAHLQSSVVGQTMSWADLRVLDRGILGPQRGYTTVDFVAGVVKDNWSVDLSLLNATDTRADIYKTAECATTVCGGQGTYVTTNRPRTLALRFSDKF